VGEGGGTGAAAQDELGAHELAVILAQHACHSRIMLTYVPVAVNLSRIGLTS
jgi:hypothetical protein